MAVERWLARREHVNEPADRCGAAEYQPLPEPHAAPADRAASAEPIDSRVTGELSNDRGRECLDLSREPL